MKVLLFLLVLIGAVAAQSATKSYPMWHESILVYSDTIEATTVTTNTVSAKEWNGTVTLFFELDSTVNTAADNGDVTVEYELYEKVSGAWYHYYNDADTETDLVTLGSAKIGLAGGIYCRMNDVATWAVADSVRWKLTVASGDSVIVSMRVAGQ